MNRKSVLLFSVFILLLMTFTISFSPTQSKGNTKKPDKNERIVPVKEVSKSLGTLKITVDPRIELLTVVQQLSDYDFLTQLDFTYKNNMMDYFSEYKKHKAVKAFSKLSNSGFYYDSPPNVMLYLSNPPSLQKKLSIPNDLISRASSKKKLYNFIDTLSDFSVDSDFKGFYNKNLPFYKTIIDNVYNNMKDMKLIEELDSYYGMEVNSYTLILAPMLHNGGYGPNIKAKNGLYDVYGIIGPSSIIKGQGEEIIPDYSMESIREIVWHEFGHSFVNPLTDKHLNEINKYDSLYSYIETKMKSQAYANWETCVDEHINRAVTARLIYLNQGQSVYDKVIEVEKKCGFFYVPALCESLTYYEANRDVYPTFESYYPELIKVFKNLSEQKLGDDFFQTVFTGPINSAYYDAATMDIAFIIPTQEKDSTIQEEIYTYVKKLRDRFFPSAEIIKDVDALDRELGNYFILAYGTMEGNLWLKHYKETFPFRLETDKIIANSTYQGTAQILISAMPNPQNYKNPLLIYTAQEAKDIININNTFHGPTDYVITKAGEEIYSGFYDKEKKIWSFPD